MAEIFRFNALTSNDVGRTTATVDCEIVFTYNRSIREELVAISDISPDGLKLNDEMYNYHEGSVSGGKYTAYFTADISGLSPGTTTLIELECTYRVETWVEDTDTEYYFYADDELFDGYSSKSIAAHYYIRERDKGRVMYPTEDDDYDTSTTYEGEKVYLFSEDVDASYWETSYDTINGEFEVYTRPSLFYFKGSNTLASGDKYPVNNIQELLKNIYNFDNVAMAWKRWRNQGSASTCNAFYEGNLSANMMNTAHNYLGTGKSYNSGDKISAEMFTTLENKLNN